MFGILTRGTVRLHGVEWESRFLFIPGLADSPQFDVAAPLRMNGKAEALNYRNDFGTRKPFLSGHAPVPKSIVTSDK
jgi:hypothetical protein